MDPWLVGRCFVALNQFNFRSLFFVFAICYNFLQKLFGWVLMEEIRAPAAEINTFSWLDDDTLHKILKN